jgi:hypothetical protein
MSSMIRLTASSGVRGDCSMKVHALLESNQLKLTKRDVLYAQTAIIDAGYDDKPLMYDASWKIFELPFMIKDSEVTMMFHLFDDEHPTNKCLIKVHHGFAVMAQIVQNSLNKLTVIGTAQLTIKDNIDTWPEAIDELVNYLTKQYAP